MSERGNKRERKWPTKRKSERSSKIKRDVSRE